MNKILLHYQSKLNNTDVEKVLGTVPCIFLPLFILIITDYWSSPIGELSCSDLKAKQIQDQHFWYETYKI